MSPNAARRRSFQSALDFDRSSCDGTGLRACRAWCRRANHSPTTSRIPGRSLLMGLLLEYCSIHSARQTWSQQESAQTPSAGVVVNSPPSSLSFAGTSLDGAFPEQPFSLGTLSYFAVRLTGIEATPSGSNNANFGRSGLVKTSSSSWRAVRRPQSSSVQLRQTYRTRRRRVALREIRRQQLFPSLRPCSAESQRAD